MISIGNIGVHVLGVDALDAHVPGGDILGGEALGVHAPGVQGWSVGRSVGRSEFHPRETYVRLKVATTCS